VIGYITNGGHQMGGSTFVRLTVAGLISKFTDTIARGDNE